MKKALVVLLIFIAAGFMYGSGEAGAVDVAVCAVVIGGDEFRFREDDGTPLWRGGGPGGGREGGERQHDFK